MASNLLDLFPFVPILKLVCKAFANVGVCFWKFLIEAATNVLRPCQTSVMELLVKIDWVDNSLLLSVKYARKRVLS